MIVSFPLFAVSRGRQELIEKNGKYLPFTAEVIKAKLDPLAK